MKVTVKHKSGSVHYFPKKCKCITVSDIVGKVILEYLDQTMVSFDLSQIECIEVTP